MSQPSEPELQGPGGSESKQGKAAIVFILITVFIDTLGFGIIIPVLPPLIMELAGLGIADGASWGGCLAAVFGISQFFMAPLLGNLSDRFGRRPVLLLSLAALGIDYILMGFAPTLAWMFVGRLLSGGFGATFATANAYVADVSAPTDRAANFGLIGATWGVGFAMGPAIGGILGEFGSRVPFFVAAGLSLLNVVYGYFVLPESLRPTDRRPFEWLRANPIGALQQIRKYPVVFGFLLVMLPYLFAHDANPATWTWYTMKKFNWTMSDVGWSLTAVGAAMFVVQGWLIRVVIDRVGERSAVYIGLGFMTFGFFGFSFATQSWMMYVLIIPFCICGLAAPALRSLMSNKVPANAQGELQGAISSLMSATAVVAPVVMTQVFSVFADENTTYYFPGASFFLAGVLVMVSISVFVFVSLRQSEAPA